MAFVIVGLGNPGQEYACTRHNVGRMVVESFAKHCDVSDWRTDKTLRALVAEGVSGEGVPLTLVLPENYMNRSGGSVAPLVQGGVPAEQLVVVHDDIDLPLGAVKVVFDRGAGGHNGVLSIEHAIKTRAFVRVRVGVLPVTVAGIVRKPVGADAVHTFILKHMTKKELESLEVVVQKAVHALSVVVHAGREAAMRECN